MMKNIGKHFGLFVLSFLVVRWFYVDYLSRYYANIVFIQTEIVRDLVLPLAIIFLLTFYLYLFLQSFFTKKIPLWTIQLFYCLYFIAMFYLLLLKNIGIQGLDLNPFSIVRDVLYGDTMIVVFNVLLFIPLGWIVKLNKSNILKVIFFIFCIEVMQYVFSLGICDIGDIIANTLGFIIGGSMQKWKWMRVMTNRITKK